MRKIILVLAINILSAFQLFACECECVGDCSFSTISKSSELVALVKVISYDDYLDEEIMGHNGKMPYSMTLEIVKKYRGNESRTRIKVWGDNGAECRPYIAYFKIGRHYLVAPDQLGEYGLPGEGPKDYAFFSCNSDYLKVNLEENKAYGHYSETRSEINLVEFEREIEK